MMYIDQDTSTGPTASNGVTDDHGRPLAVQHRTTRRGTAMSPRDGIVTAVRWTASVILLVLIGSAIYSWGRANGRTVQVHVICPSLHEQLSPSDRVRPDADSTPPASMLVLKPGTVGTVICHA